MCDGWTTVCYGRPKEQQPAPLIVRLNRTQTLNGTHLEPEAH